MSKTAACCSSALILADQFLDRIPLASSISNLVDIFQKSVFIPLIKTKHLTSSRYFVHLKVKSFFRCLILLVPIAGNFIIWLIDRSQLAPSSSIPSPSRRRALELSHKIAQIKKDDSEFPENFGWYRRSGPVLHNIMMALEKYASTDNLSTEIDPCQIQEIKEPRKLREVFKDALDSSSHGGLLQTIHAIKKGPGKNTFVANKFNSQLSLLLFEEELINLIKELTSK